MHKKRFHFFREFAKKTKRLFRARNVIIVSDHTLDHVPLTGTMQVLILVGVLGFFSGISYLTGSYMNVRGVIREKDKTIVRARAEKAHINDEMEQLRRDVASFSRNSKELADNSRFLSEHFSSHTFNFNAATQQNGNPLFNQDSDKLTLRVAYLENRIRQMHDENDQLVTAIRVRTDKKIDLFEDIIAMTGLDEERLEKAASAKLRSDAEKNAAAVPAPVKQGKDNQGGPFIAAREGEQDIDQQLLANVDRMVMLHSIIDQLPLARPVRNAQLTSPFGRRIDPFNGRVAIHPGQDFAAPFGTRIAAANSGKIVHAGRMASYGNAVDIEHGFGIVTRYAHLSKVLVKEGDRVRKGQIIGLEGSTGRSTGPHLHYEVRIDDHPVNPAKFLQAGEYVSEK